MYEKTIQNPLQTFTENLYAKCVKFFLINYFIGYYLIYLYIIYFFYFGKQTE